MEYTFHFFWSIRKWWRWWQQMIRWCCWKLWWWWWWQWQMWLIFSVWVSAWEQIRVLQNDPLSEYWSRTPPAKPALLHYNAVKCSPALYSFWCFHWIPLQCTAIQCVFCNNEVTFQGSTLLLLLGWHSICLQKACPIFQHAMMTMTRLCAGLGMMTMRRNFIQKLILESESIRGSVRLRHVVMSCSK